MIRHLLVALSLAACGSAPPPVPSGPPPIALETIEGTPIYPTPIAEASQEVRAIHAAMQAVLSEQLRAPRNPSLSDMQQWTESTFHEYLSVQAERLQALDELVAAFLPNASPLDRAFAALAVGLANEHFYRAIVGVPVPEEIRSAAELLEIFMTALRDAGVPIAQRAANAFSECLAAELPESMQAWTDRCRARQAELGAIERSEPPRDNRPIRWSEDCATAPQVTLPPDAPPPDLRRPAEIAIVYEGDDADTPERVRLVEAVRARVDELVDVAVLPSSEITSATQLQNERRLRARGPVCGREPALAHVLAQRHRNLIVGSVESTCSEDDDDHERCELVVSFARAGSDSREGLPSTIGAAMDGDPGSIDAWMAAVPRLAGGFEPSGALLGILRGSGAHDVRVLDNGEEDPWLALPRVLAQRADVLGECIDDPASFDARWTVSPTGDTSAIQVSMRGQSSAQASACVQHALAETHFGCTLATRPQSVAITLCIGHR